MIHSKTKHFFILVFLVFCSSCISSSEKNTQRDISSDSVMNEFLDQETQDSPSFDLDSQDTLFDEQLSIVKYKSYKEDDQFLYYTAAPGETLMLLAFKFYSDHRQWKKIFKANSNELDGLPDITKFVELRLPKPLKQFQEPNGMPYLIKPGDSLSLISRKVYGEMKWWQEIWKNNQEMISDPNLIFAGFTLFYQDKEQEAPSQEYRLF